MSPSGIARWQFASHAGYFWLAACLLIAGYLGLWSHGTKHEVPDAPSVAAASEVPLPTKNIEDIQVGDVVLAREEHGSKLAPKRVDQVYRRVADHLRILEIESADGSTQTLKTTNEHPFWVHNRGWVNAGELLPGDRLESPGGELLKVARTTLEAHREGIPVFNFRVEDYHTYHVAEDEDSQALLVHNADYPNGSFSIVNWTNYPSFVPRPQGPFMIIGGDLYKAMEKLKKSANRKIHNSRPELAGRHLHEIHPVKWGGDPVDLANKIDLPAPQHHVVSGWWESMYQQLKDQVWIQK